MLSLGRSPMATACAFGSPAEVRASLDHPALGPRLIGATRLVMAAESMTLTAILGTLDELRLCIGVEPSATSFP